MNRPAARWPRRLVATSMIFASITSIACAREGLYVGGGLAAQSATGDLNGSRKFVYANNSVAYLAGKLDTGTGPDLTVGYGFNRNFSLEFLAAATSHTATHRYVDFKSNASLLSGLASARVNFEVLPALEVFGRAGRSFNYAIYSDYALHGDIAGHNFSRTGAAQFDGGGLGFGVGAEWFRNRIGISPSLNVMQVEFTNVTDSSTVRTLPKNLVATIYLFAVTVTFYFKR